MAYSLGLTLYHLAAKREGSLPSDRPARPAGRLIWLHSPTAESLRAIAELARRIVDEDGHSVLLTSPAPIEVGDVIWQPAPGDRPSEAAVFLTYWRPDAILTAEGEVRPSMLHEASERNIPLMMVDGRAPYILKDRNGWYPGLMKSSLQAYQVVVAQDDTAARALRRAGAVAQLTGRMEEPSAALRCNEAERAAMARGLGTRPVWLAADIPEAEESAIIEAHRAGLRLAHRLLLIVVTEDPARAAVLADKMEREEGWQVASRALEQEPDSETEVYFADSSEYGLWYRLAPITFLGGSLTGLGCLRDPLEPAALGSSIIHGPRPGAFGRVFGRLGAARAARSVASARDLGEALGDLLSPDSAARLAQAAWAVASDGVEVTDQVLARLRQLLGEA